MFQFLKDLLKDIAWHLVVLVARTLILWIQVDLCRQLVVVLHWLNRLI